MSYNQETGLYEGFIYLIENDINHNKYIGQTSSSIQERFRQHKYSGYKSVLFKAMKKYGRQNFSIHELERNSFKTKEELKQWLNQREIYYISKYHTYDKEGYNATPGGDSPYIYCTKSVDVYDITGKYLKSFDSCYDADRFYGVCYGSVGQICIGKILRLLNYPELVFRFSTDAFNKYPLESKTVRIIYQYTLEGECIGVYRTTHSIKEKYHIDPGALLYAIHNKKVFLGYYWSYLSEFDNLMTTKTGVPVDQYTKDGQYIKTFLTASEASQAVTKSHSTKQNYSILQCCRGNKNYASGYVWRFRGEPFDKYNVDLSLSFYKPVDQYSKNGVLLNTFINANEAAQSLGKINGSHILAVCNGTRNSSYGYIWRHHGEAFDKQEG